VVDTIGLNDKTFVDNYPTPHGEKLHVTERWKLIDDGNMLEVKIRVEDADTYYEPWSAILIRRRHPDGKQPGFFSGGAARQSDKSARPNSA
jgi:hypothetical protein